MGCGAEGRITDAHKKRLVWVERYTWSVYEGQHSSDGTLHICVVYLLFCPVKL